MTKTILPHQIEKAAEAKFGATIRKLKKDVATLKKEVAALKSVQVVTIEESNERVLGQS